MIVSIQEFRAARRQKAKSASRATREERKKARKSRRTDRKEAVKRVGRGAVDSSLAVAEEATGMFGRLIQRAKNSVAASREKNKAAARTAIKFGKSEWINAAKVLGASAAIGGAGLVAGTAADKLIDVTTKPIDRAISYKKMLKKNPDLKKLPTNEVKDVFRSLHHFSPYTAADPGVAGGWVRRAMQFKDIGPQASDAKELSSIQANIKSPSKVRAVTDSIFAVRGGDNLLTQTMG